MINAAGTLAFGLPLDFPCPSEIPGHVSAHWRQLLDLLLTGRHCLDLFSLGTRYIN